MLRPDLSTLMPCINYCTCYTLMLLSIHQDISFIHCINKSIQCNIGHNVYKQEAQMLSFFINQFICIGNHAYIAGLILGLRPANDRHRYKVTVSLIGWDQTENQPCIGIIIPPSSYIMASHWPCAAWLSHDSSQAWYVHGRCAVPMFFYDGIFFLMVLYAW